MDLLICTIIGISIETVPPDSELQMAASIIQKYENVGHGEKRVEIFTFQRVSVRGASHPSGLPPLVV